MNNTIKCLVAACTLLSASAWGSLWGNDSSNVMDDRGTLLAKCEDGRMVVEYTAKDKAAKTEVWSNGHPMQCTQEFSPDRFATLDGKALSFSEAGDLINAAVHQHIIVREARLPLEDFNWFNRPVQQVSAASLSNVLKSIGDVNVRDIGEVSTRQ